MNVSGFDLTATTMLSGFASRELSPVDVMRSVLDRAAQWNPAINALIFQDDQAALAQAERSEARWAKGIPKGLLDGVPVTVKDSIAEASRPMLRGMSANAGAGPVGYDAPPAARLKDAGAIIWAKTTMPDFGLSPYGVSSAYGVTRNPWNLACNPGGSSSGAAAATAARCGPMAIGTDIGGSVRLPAALCGLVGFKPTQGRVPHLPPSTARSAGPLTRTVADNALLLTVLAQADARDYGSMPPETVAFAEDLDRDVRGLRIALQLESYNGCQPDPSVRQAVENAAATFERAGAIVELVPCVAGPDIMALIELTLVVRGSVELSHMTETAIAQTPERFLEWFRRADGRSALDLAIAHEKLDKAKQRILTQLATFDYLLSPTLAFSAAPAEADDVPRDGDLAAYYTPAWNHTGNPAISLCCGFDAANGMPIGLQIVGHRFDDLGVLQMAAAYERLRSFDIFWPDCPS